MRFSVLGPLRIDHGGAEVVVSAPRQKSLLGLLLVHANEVVSTDRILDDLWGDEAPASGVKTLHYHVSKLREALGDGVELQTRAPGYLLEVRRDELDVFEFEDLAAAGRAQLGADQEQAASTLKRALALWRGAPFADYAYEGFASAEVNRLEVLQRTVVADRIDAELGTGRHDELIAELEGLVGAHPYDERYRGQLMKALYRAGRQADALQAFQDARALLGEELGIDPSAELQALEEQILLQAPELASPSLSTTTFNLPSYLSRFVGRIKEVEEVDSLLASNRLVTLVGLGGIGKTRIAVEAAGCRRDQHHHGVAMVDLSSIVDSAAVPQAFADGLGLGAEPNVAIEDSIASHLARRDVLVLVDNCEQVLDDVAALVHTLLASAPSVTMLATSREPLGVPGEVTFRVPPLSVDLPADADGIPDAVRLFLDRAQLRRGDLAIDDAFRDVALQVCARLDGIPLAIELAAARLRALSIVELDQQLEHRFDVLTGGDRTAPERHRTLQATLDWSYDTLTDEEQKLLRRLAVFRGDFDLDAVSQCAPGPSESRILDVVTRLCDTSLVVASAERPVRYRLLETIRDYSHRKLQQAGEEYEAMAKHARYFREKVDRCSAEIASGDRGAGLAELAMDGPNIQAAFEWAVSNDKETALDIAGGMGECWFHRGSHQVARRNLSVALLFEDQTNTDNLMKALKTMTLLAVWDGRNEEAEQLTSRHKALAMSTSDTMSLAESFATQATVAWGRGDNRRARELLLQALAEVGDDVSPEATSWVARVSFHSSWMGDVETAEDYAMRLERMRLDEPRLMLDALIHDAHGTILLQVGDLEGAVSRFRDACDIYDDLGMLTHVQDMLQSAAGALIDLGRIDEAVPDATRALSLSRALADQRIGARSLLLQGRIATELGHREQAHQGLSAALRMSYRAGDRAGVMLALLAMATLAATANEAAESLLLHGLADAVREGIDVELPAVSRQKAEVEIAEARAALDRLEAQQIWDGSRIAGYVGAVKLADSLTNVRGLRPSRSAIAGSIGDVESGGT